MASERYPQDIIKPSKLKNDVNEMRSYTSLRQCNATEKLAPVLWSIWPHFSKGRPAAQCFRQEI